LEKPREFEFVTFDCYGTLIDWETGIRRAFKQALEGTGLSQTQEGALFELYQEEEKRIEGQMPYRPYREVLSLAASGAAEKIRKEHSGKIVKSSCRAAAKLGSFPRYESGP
jgi:2-haloacid dehalogenase